MPGHPASFRLINIGAQSGPRRDSFVDSWAGMMGRAPDSIAWADALAAPDRLRLTGAAHGEVFVRFDSPDADRAALTALYRRGEDAAAAAGVETLTPAGFAATQAGDIGSPTQLALGMVDAARTLVAASDNDRTVFSALPSDIHCAFDKVATRERLIAADIPVPRTLHVDGGFDALASAMTAASMPRAFVKLRHGFAAAGMVALARNGPHWTATTTAVIGDDDRPYATRAVRRLTDGSEIARVIDRLGPLGLHVEQWVPKLGLAGRTIDLRVVVIGGEHVFPVVRASHHPITNLHIGGQRQSADALAAAIGDTAWQSLLATARKTARLFPSALSVGIDMAVLVGGQRHVVLEVNIFGDHIRDFAVDGRTVHQAQIAHIAAIMEQRRADRGSKAA